jgi:hypothetical protein
MIDVTPSARELAVMDRLLIITGSVMILSEIDHVGSTSASLSNTYVVTR